jgi:predicted CoA-substrate-specific enzyme activase
MSGKTNARYAAGVDSGSASTDVVILDRQGKIVGSAILPTGAGASAGADKALEAAIQSAGITREDIGTVVSTGYGRDHIAGGNASVTEITCHARGAHHLLPGVRTIIDIGGQDSKVIRLDENGQVINFVMNDKCAAGTGRFLELMARTLEMTLPEMSEKGRHWNKPVSISSMCTVFAESEVVSLIAGNTDPADIIHGLNMAVANKTASLVMRLGGQPAYVMTGGVAMNRGVVEALEEKLKAEIIVPREAQLCGALGAALFALDAVR